MKRAGRVLRLLKREGEEPRPEAMGPIGSAVEGVLVEALRRRASDLHLDPTPAGTRVRFRVDGFFEEGERLPSNAHEKLVARVKVLAGLTVYRRDEIQEGAIRRSGGIDLRVSVLPTVAGEKVTIRVFDPATRPFRLEELGFRTEVGGSLGRFADLRQGTVIAAGPSGSGKTTTLYALLHRIRERRGEYTNLCSVEDPVEFALEGAHQLQVNRERGLGFARGLAALLRQDPEVILVGEVRDRETAAIAVEAGMTGHLVLTSVHAGTAAEALTRLLDLGVEPYLAATSLKGIVAQRLVRRVCEGCAEPREPDEALLEALGAPGDGRWRAGRGCPDCRGTGYRGRVPIGEVLDVDRTLASRILAREEAASLARGLSGGRTLLDEALARACEGETTVEEVARVTDPEEVRT